MQDPSVERLFQEQLSYYSRQDQSAKISRIIPLFLVWAKKKKLEGPKIAEFGGAAGQLLAEINKSYPQSELTNIEIIAGYKSSQILKKIRFVHGSILNSKFPESSFDVLIIRDVLHHLVGKNLEKSRDNQKKALKELWRTLKPGGAIFIEELVNNSPLACRLIYYLSRLNSKIGVRAPIFQISPHTILAFLTPTEFLNLAREIFGQKSIRKVKFERTNVEWQYHLVHLGAKSGKIFVVVEKS